MVSSHMTSEYPVPFCTPPAYRTTLPPFRYLEQVADHRGESYTPRASLPMLGPLTGRQDSDHAYLPSSPYTTPRLQSLVFEPSQSRRSSLAPSLASASSSKENTNLRGAISKSTSTRGSKKARTNLSVAMARKGGDLNMFDPTICSREHLEQRRHDVTDLLQKMTMSHSAPEIDEYEPSNDSSLPNVVHNEGQKRLRNHQARHLLGSQRVLVGTLGWSGNKPQSSGNAKASGLIYQTKDTMEAMNNFGGLSIIMLKVFIKPENLCLLGPRLRFFRLQPTDIITDADRKQAIADALHPVELEEVRSIADEVYLLQTYILPLAREEMKDCLASYCAEALTELDFTPPTPPTSPPGPYRAAL